MKLIRKLANKQKLLFSAPVNDVAGHQSLMEQTGSKVLFYTDDMAPYDLFKVCSNLPCISVPTTYTLSRETKVKDFPYEKSYNKARKDLVVVSVFHVQMGNRNTANLFYSISTPLDLLVAQKSFLGQMRYRPALRFQSILPTSMAALFIHASNATLLDSLVADCSLQYLRSMKAWDS